MEQELFKIVSPHKPTGDQPEAIKKLVDGINEGKKLQVLLGATGTGKTFTISNDIEKIQKPTLVIVHNKTLAGQLYEEFKEMFPHNRVEYFVSNFDFYQPDSYENRHYGLWKSRDYHRWKCLKILCKCAY